MNQQDHRPNFITEDAAIPYQTKMLDEMQATLSEASLANSKFWLFCSDIEILDGETGKFVIIPVGYYRIWAVDDTVGDLTVLLDLSFYDDDGEPHIINEELDLCDVPFDTEVLL